MISIEKCKPGNKNQFEPANIIRVQAHSNYCKIHFTNQRGTIVVSEVLHRVQDKLPAQLFLRIHRSHLVNKLYIKQVLGTQTKKVELTNGEFVAVSRRRHAVFQNDNLQ